MRPNFRIITIWLVSYNHENYIKQAIKSILAQQVPDGWRIEVVWLDDASEDQTVVIGDVEFLGSPEIFLKRIHHTVNRFSLGHSHIASLVEKTHGEFVAMMEGDDYWVDPYKLSKQVAALEENPQLNLCFSRANTLRDDGAVVDFANYGSQVGIASLETVIENDGGFMPTATLMIRRSVFEKLPKSMHASWPVGDYIFQVFGSFPSGALYLPDVTAVYRESSINSWSLNIAQDAFRRASFHLKFVKLLCAISKEIPGYQKFFSRLSMRHVSSAMGAIESCGRDELGSELFRHLSEFDLDRYKQ